MDSSKLMAERIRQRRNALGYTMEELGAMVGVQSSAVNKWEHGTVSNIPRSRIHKLAIALECDPVWLMGIDSQSSEAISNATSDIDKEIIDLLSHLPLEKKEIILNLLRSMENK